MKHWMGALAIAATTLAPIAASADWDDHHYEHRENGAFQRGYERGQQDGRHQGWRDGRHHDRFDLWGQRDYRDADSGYKRWFGPRAAYMEGYRRGYAASYRSAYRAAVNRDEDRHDWDRRDWDRRDRW